MMRCVAVFLLPLLVVGMQPAPVQGEETAEDSTAASEPLKGDRKQEAQRRLETLLLNKQVTAKVTFPGSKDGIDLKIDGTWDMKRATRLICKLLSKMYTKVQQN